MNLKEWAKAQGVHPHAAYRWFREGTLPVPATWVGPRTILVNVEANAAPEAVGGVGLYARVSSQEQQAVGAGAGGARRQAPGEHPAPLADLANAGHGRYVLACRVVSHTGARSGPTGSPPTGRWPTPSTTTRTGTAGT